MKIYWIMGLTILAAMTFVCCTNAQKKDSENLLSPKEFTKKMKELPDSPVIDVRTPEEFSEGHLSGAINMDWKNDNFINQIKTLDKSVPVLIYCRSGKRSEDAAEKMRSEGFKQVYELQGGILEMTDI